MKTLTFKIVGLALFLSIGFNVAGVTIYDTTGNYNNTSFVLANNQEIGNEVFLSSANQHMTDFSFQYYSPNSSFAGNVGVTLRFYKNDGPPTGTGYPTPGTLFYDSGLFNNGGSLPAGGGAFTPITYDLTDLYATATLNLGPGSSLPTDFTFTVTFQGLSGSDQIGVPRGSPDLSGIATGFGDYWLKTGSSWALLTNSAASSSMLASFSAEPIPEPSLLCLGAVGSSLLVLGAARLRKRAGKLVKGE